MGEAAQKLVAPLEAVDSAPIAAAPPEQAAEPADLWRKVAATVAVRVYSLLAQAIIVFATATAFGAKGRGDIAAGWAWASLFATVVAVCLGQAASYHASNVRGDGWLRETLATMLRTMLVGVPLAWLVGASLWTVSGRHIFGDTDPLVLGVAMLALPFLVWGQYQPYLLTAIQRLDLANRANWLGRTAAVVAMLAVLQFSGNVAAAVVALVIGEAIVSLVGVNALRARAGALWLREQTSWPLLSSGAVLLPGTIGSLLLLSGQLFVIQALVGAHETGAFQLAAFIIEALALPAGASGLVASERVTGAGPANSWNDTKRLILGLGALTAFGALCAGIAVPFLVPRLLGAEFAQTTTYFFLLLPTLVGRVLSALMTPQWVGRGRLWQLSAVMLGLGLANTILGVVLVSDIGPLGAIIAANCAFGALAAFHVAYAFQIENQSVEARAQRTPNGHIQHHRVGS